jgi:propionyl-CoA synthetase
MGKFDELYQRSIRDPEGFWGEAAEALHWERRWDRVLDDSRPPFYRWFAGGELNTCYNAIDRHVEAGRGAQPAVIHDSPVTDSRRILTYAELQDQTARFAGLLKSLGVGYGDRSPSIRDHRPSQAARPEAQ